MKKIFAIAFALTVGAGALPAQAQTYQLGLAGASPGGLWSFLGVGIDRAVKASYPGSVVSYQTSGGGLANIGLLDSGKVQLGIAHNVELKIARHGEKPFSKPINSIRGIAMLYDWAPMQFIITKEFSEKYGIRSLDDLAKKKAPVRLTTNRRGNIVEYVGRHMLSAAGLTYEDVEKNGGAVVFAAGKEQTNLYKDRRVDMFINGIFVRTSYLLEATKAVDSVILEIPDAVVKKVTAETGTKAFTIPAGAYAFQHSLVTTPALGAALVATERLDEKTAYALTKALHKNIDKLQGVHGAMKALTEGLMVSLDVIPYHPGAVRYYKEAGLMK